MDTSGQLNPVGRDNVAPIHRGLRGLGSVAGLCLLALVAGFMTLAQAADREVSFDLSVPVAPMARSVEGTNELAYELHLSNFATGDLQPVRVEVLDAADGRTLAAYEGPALEQRLDRSGLQWKANTFHAIPSGRRGVLFIDLAVPASLPQELRHRVSYRGTAADSPLRQVEGGSTAVLAGKALVLSAPLRGGPWVAVYDTRWERGHRRVGFALGGRLRTPGRYAVDWVKLDASGRKSAPGNDLASGTYSHGEDVLAVADGVVVRVIDRAPQRLRLADPLADTDGNHIVLALDNGHFAHYAHYGHLRPGSATVRPGMRVRSGEKIAEVGFSGSASDPQLHLAITDGPEELASEGLAYTFESYRLLGRFTDVSEIGRAWAPVERRESSRGTIPAALSVLRWPG
jgi:murein DD-endopeptidase